MAQLGHLPLEALLVLLPLAIHPCRLSQLVPVDLAALEALDSQLGLAELAAREVQVVQAGQLVQAGRWLQLALARLVA